MSDNIAINSLSDDSDWSNLSLSIDPQNNISAVKGVLKHLKILSAKSVIIENEYLDRDFTAAFSEFYATVFKRHTKLCRRFHFFRIDITNIFLETDPAKLSQGLQESGENDEYIGFVVVRPIAHAPLGCVVISVPKEPNSLKSYLLVNAEYEVHLLGATFRINGMPLTQQDSRVGACAQASIWMAGRHFHTRHRGKWFSTVDITKAATKVADFSLSRSLPAGSEFLGLNNMVQALRAMDREPFTYIGVDPNKNMAINWGKLRPRDIINRYVDSGIPVILGLQQESGIGHAVVATGHSLKEINSNVALPIEPTRAEFCEAFLVNDDQRGINLRMPVMQASALGETSYSVEQHVSWIIIPLPSKVFIPAENAEKLAWELLKNYRNDWKDHKTFHNDNLGGSTLAGDEFVGAIDANKVMARTYLTYGWKYKARMLANDIGTDFKRGLLYHEFPRYVWVTEFGTLESLNHINFKARRIFSHAVIDATASKFWESRCMFHAPGFGLRWYHDPDNIFGDYKDAVTPVADDAEYYPKFRGSDGFDMYRN